MAPPVRFMPDKWFPRPHTMHHDWAHGLETGAENAKTIYPICFQDEGLGTPSGYSANIQNAGFAVAAEANCYPDSKVGKIFSQFTFALSKYFFSADALNAVNIGYMVIAMNFKDDHTADDQLTGTTIDGLLEMTFETTDRQSIPEWNGIDMVAKTTGKNILPTKQSGLTATQAIEGITFSEDQYYDGLQFYQNQGKLKKVQHGLKWFSLTKNHPTARIRINQKSASKAMNEYAFLGLLITIPPAGDIRQYHTAGETTDVSHVYVSTLTKYLEWNEAFDMERV